MTIVEFFDNEAIDNAMGAILLKPERVVFLYNEKKDDAFIAALDKIFKSRGIKTEILTEYIDVSDIEKAKNKIYDVAKRFPDCDFDIAGGSDVMLVAIGEVARELGLPLHTVNVRKKQVTAINSQRKYEVFDTFLTVEELIALHGGKASRDAREKETYTWQRNYKGEEDIEKVWNICKSDPGAWNSAIGTMRGYRTDKRGVLTMMWSKLKKDALVRSDSNGVRYKNDLVRYLLGKQGTALEMFTYATAKSAEFFDDGQSGVVIDWKGRREIENEIDVLLVRGAIGYFVSCKNGLVDSDELYKLSTVAKRFGGSYAKKILVLTHFEPDLSFMERAEELGIKVIKNVKHLTKKDFAKRLIG